jgi:hypothetical protein
MLNPTHTPNIKAQCTLFIVTGLRNPVFLGLHSLVL